MRGLIRFLFFSCLVYGGWKKFKSIDSQDLSVVVQSDGQLSDNAREVIKGHVQSLLTKALPINEIGYLLHKAFPYLAHVSVIKNPCNKLTVAVSASKPLVMCNESVVLCYNDHIVDKGIFCIIKHSLLHNR